MVFGAQLYTVREHAKNLEDFAETLKKVADIGYTAVQVSGTCEFEAEWLKEQLDKNGLVCPLTHTKADRITGETEKVIREHDIFGAKYIGLGYRKIQAENEGYDKFESLFRPAAEQIKQAGKLFMYHHHELEFELLDGTMILDTIAERFPADIMGFTLDTYWVKRSGYEPVDYIRKLSGRVHCVHFKDLGEENRMEWLGNGTIDFDPIIAACADAGTEYIFVEQDNCNGEDPFECLRKSYEYLRARGLK